MVYVVTIMKGFLPFSLEKNVAVLDSNLISGSIKTIIWY
jgi:hypothetical protein